MHGAASGCLLSDVAVVSFALGGVAKSHLWSTACIGIYLSVSLCLCVSVSLTCLVVVSLPSKQDRTEPTVLAAMRGKNVLGAAAGAAHSAVVVMYVHRSIPPTPP